VKEEKGVTAGIEEIGVPFIMARIALTVMWPENEKTDLFSKEVMGRRHGSGLMEFMEFGVVWNF
jgi:hypothetical protein